jgi:hypothetical protein
MKTNDPWNRLATMVKRREPVPPAAVMPYGFDTRVLAHARPPRELAAVLFGKLAWRAIPLGLAVLATCWLTARPQPDAVWPDDAALANQIMEEMLQP